MNFVRAAPMIIPFTKAHGAQNDFLLTSSLMWTRRSPHAATADFAAIARAICGRHTGIGADGWLLVTTEEIASGAPSGKHTADARIELWNSDGSTSPISGNGTRCAAAFLIDSRPAEAGVEGGHAGRHLRIATGAGVKDLRLIERKERRFVFEMNMGRARVDELHARVQGSVAVINDAVIVDVGNPQCAVFVDNFDFDWQSAGALIERDSRFPDRTNVSFVRVLDRHTLDVRFFERGAGVTMSSGTGSTGAAAAAAARGLVDTQVDTHLAVQTPAGPLQIRWQGEEILLAGPAEIIGSGEYYWDMTNISEVR
jgi:diaminopimelate epimerase